MTARWRIRHKLMLGLGLVVLLIVLLLGGTLRGFWTYYLTINNIRSTLAELESAEEFKDSVTRLSTPHTLEELERHPGLVKIKTAEVREKLEAYRELLDGNVENHNADNISHERALVEVMLVNIDDFEKAVVEEASRPRMIVPGQRRSSLDKGLSASDAETDEHRTYLIASLWGCSALHTGARPLFAGASLIAAQKYENPVRLHVRNLGTNAADLRDTICERLNTYIGESRRNYQVSLWIIIPASVVGLLSMAGLMRSFYAWVFYPIRDLEAGVKRVACGDFQHRIELASGDEMEDLADAFDEMTQRLEALYSDLARQVNERSRQLVRSERLASVGFLAAGVAHEINNPLHSIALCSEALEARLVDLLGEIHKKPKTAEDLQIVNKYLRMIQEEAFRCKKITEKLLEFSRTGERKREMTDVGKLIQSVLDVAQLHQNSKGKQIILEMDANAKWYGERICAPINVEEIKSVYLNLVINALESMEEGGMLTIRLGQRDGMVETVLSDTGCGMTQEVLDNIFEPFFTRSQTGKGTGLGLTISHRIIVQHGGELEASSAGPNQGSRFIVRLPLEVDDRARKGGEGPRLAA